MAQGDEDLRYDDDTLASRLLNRLVPICNDRCNDLLIGRICRAAAEA